LALHTNITVIERELHLAVRTALTEVFTAAEYQKTFSKDMNKALATILKDMDRISIRIRQSYRASESEIVGALADIRDEAEVARKETASTFSWLRQVFTSSFPVKWITDKILGDPKCTPVHGNFGCLFQTILVTS